MKSCPGCRHAVTEAAVECAACGLIFSKFKEREERLKATPASTPPPSYASSKSGYSLWHILAFFMPYPVDIGMLGTSEQKEKRPYYACVTGIIALALVCFANSLYQSALYGPYPGSTPYVFLFFVAPGLVFAAGFAAMAIFNGIASFGHFQYTNKRIFPLIGIVAAMVAVVFGIYLLPSKLPGQRSFALFFAGDAVHKKRPRQPNPVPYPKSERPPEPAQPHPDLAKQFYQGPPQYSKERRIAGLNAVLPPRLDFAKGLEELEHNIRKVPDHPEIYVDYCLGAYYAARAQKFDIAETYLAQCPQKIPADRKTVIVDYQGLVKYQQDTRKLIDEGRAGR